MLMRIRTFITNHTIWIFLFFLFLTAGLGIYYTLGLQPNTKSINEIIKKFTVNDYSISYYVAERYLIWIHMRTFFVMLYYLLTLIGLVASLMTVFYATKSKKTTKQIIVFLSLLSMYFSIANIFINPNSKANMAQHSWRELEICITETIYRNELSANDKDIIINNKIAEIEKYIESFER